MEHLKERYRGQIEKSRKKMREVSDFTNETPATYICESYWWVFGQLPEKIPPNYSQGNIKGMLDYQVSMIKNHYEQDLDDCMEPILSPWYGTGVLPSAFGQTIAYKEGQDPAVEVRVPFDEEFVKKMKIPDPYKDGQMPIVLETIDYFRDHCDLDINLTDLQGPLSSAFNLVGYENFIYWMYDEPELVHELMEKVSEAIIAWVRVQKQHMGISDFEPSSQMHVRGVTGGVFLSDDEAILFDAESYAEFVKPYNEKIFAEFGGGQIHCCGNVSHQAKNLAETKGLTMYHNMILGGFEHAAVTQKYLSDAHIPYVAGDFNPSDESIDAYYENVMKTLKPQGLTIASYIAPATSMINGKYEIARRDADAVSQLIHHCMEKKMRKYYYMKRKTA